jgi:hypothetical protein
MIYTTDFMFFFSQQGLKFAFNLINVLYEKTHALLPGYLFCISFI